MEYCTLPVWGAQHGYIGEQIEAYYYFAWRSKILHQNSDSETKESHRSFHRHICPKVEQIIESLKREVGV